ncbi:MAG: hypothetical protein OXD45_08205 [Rhodobacteraceae bacterium]|nr:hypothetical protein [Paracoccaceae bacterium]
MTNIISIQTSQTTLGDLVIEMMATQPTWPSQNGQGNLVIDTEPSYSIVIDQIKSNLEKKYTNSDFLRDLADRYMYLGQRQEHLGKEFEAAIFQDIPGLYEA